MGKFLYKIKAKLLTFFGDIRYSKLPFFLFYDDINFSVRGKQVEEILSVLKKGDIVLRGYDKYIDSFFIKSERKYSHAGIYVGNGEIIHAVAPSVEKTHVIDFCQCDRIAILRPSKGITKAIRIAKKFLKNKVFYDFSFAAGAQALYCFELAAYCYPDLSIEKETATAFFGLLKKKEKVYLSDGFFKSKDFNLIYEYNPRFNIHFKMVK